MDEPPKGFGKMPEPKLKFADGLSALCAMELAAAHGDEDRIGEMIERLINSVSFTIAVASRGDMKAMDTMIAGAESYLATAVTGHQKFGAFIEQAKRKGSANG